MLYWVLANEFLTSEEESTLGIFKVKVAPPVKSIPGLSPPKIIKIKPIIIIRLETLKKDNLYFERFMYFFLYKISLRPEGTYKYNNLDKIE